MTDGELNLRDYLTVLRRRWKLIAIATLVITVAAASWSATRTKQYSSGADVLVDFELSAQLSDPANQGRSISDRARRLENELQFARSVLVEQEAQRRLGFRGEATAKASSSADIITFTATDPDAEVAANEANTFAEAFRDLRASRTAENFTEGIANIDALLEDLRSQVTALGGDTSSEATAARAGLQSQIQTQEARRNALSLVSDASQDKSAVIINTAEAAEAPVSPKPVRTAVLALVLALMASTGIAFLLEFLDDRIRTKDDFDRVTGLPSLGLVPRSGVTGSGVVDLDPNTLVAETFRTLRTSIRFAGLRQPLRSLQITSANPAEGKTTVACNLAVAIARSGVRVVLIDADLRSPRVHQRFGLPSNEVGLSSVMLRQLPLAETMFAVAGCDGLWIMPSGPTPGNPADFLWPADAGSGITSLPEVIDELIAQEFMVLVDTPPVLPVADALTLSRVVDGTVFVAAAGSTGSRSIARALEMLGQADARIIGTVLNRVTEDLQAYGYGYGYGQTKGGKRKAKPAGPTAATAPAHATLEHPTLAASPAATHVEPVVQVTQAVNGHVVHLPPTLDVEEPAEGAGVDLDLDRADAAAPGARRARIAPPVSPHVEEAAAAPPVPAPASGAVDDDLVGKLRTHLGLEHAGEPRSNGSSH